MPTSWEINQSKEKNDTEIPNITTHGRVEEQGKEMRQQQISEGKEAEVQPESEELTKAKEGKAQGRGTGKGQTPKEQQKGKQTEKGKGGRYGKSKKSSFPQKSKDSIRKLEEQLQEPVDLKDLASRYGLDFEKMQKLVDDDEEVGEDKRAIREARRDVSVLKTIQRYLQNARKAIRIHGNRVHMVLRRLPGSLLTVEEKSCESLSRTGHRIAHNYTKLLGNAIYRCPIPGCGAATINSASIARSTPVYFRAFHRKMDAVFVIKIELRNGWDFIQVPEQTFGEHPKMKRGPSVTQTQEDED